MQRNLAAALLERLTDPHGHGSLRPIFGAMRRYVGLLSAGSGSVNFAVSKIYRCSSHLGRHR